MRIRLILCRYGRDKCFDELLDFAAEMLVAGGRLVYWLPVIQAGDTFQTPNRAPATRRGQHSKTGSLDNVHENVRR
jgi:tRNA G10  N-methylase Trm11